MLVTVFISVAIAVATVHAQQTCQLTAADILGPYYIAGAPQSQDQLCSNTPAHDRLVLTGQVVDFDSQCRRGIPNVRLDVWQANYNGVYSTGKSASDWWCRGVFQTDVNGRFRITTLFPGRYDDGGYRPAHIHFNITAAGFPGLVTQLYFNQDYYLSPRDSCTRCRSDASSLVLAATHRNDIKTFEGDWTIVLSKTPRIHFPPLSRSTLNRGSYVDVKPHIMH